MGWLIARQFLNELDALIAIFPKKENLFVIEAF